MALVVEDGTVVSGAESYITVAAADTYHSNRGNTEWDDLDDTTKEQLLRKATDYMTQKYRERWKGDRVSLTQPLDWPRESVKVYYGETLWEEFDDESVPDAVVNACAELALKANTEDLMADLTRGITREKIGPLETEYDTNSPQAKRFKAIDAMLKPYLMNTQGFGIRA